eukprot:1531626-Alexandrium_andersonii.AAC.1
MGRLVSNPDLEVADVVGVLESYLREVGNRDLWQVLSEPIAKATCCCTNTLLPREQLLPFNPVASHAQGHS